MAAPNATGWEPPASISDGKPIGLQSYKKDKTLGPYVLDLSQPTNCTEKYPNVPKGDPNAQRNFFMRDQCNQIKGCKTQITIDYDSGNLGHHIYGDKQPAAKSPYTCTSCKPGFTFVTYHHKSRAGLCPKYDDKSFVHCTEMGKDRYFSAPDAKHMVCTKVELSKQRFRSGTLKKEAAKKFFEPVQGTFGLSMAYCRVRKETLCRGSHCIVNKQVSCEKLCKAVGHEHVDCSDKYCKHEKYGALVCLE